MRRILYRTIPRGCAHSPMMKLQELARRVIEGDADDEFEEMVSLAYEIDDTIASVIDAGERASEVLTALTDFPLP